MKQIENFVDEIYQNAKGSRKEIQESKAEMKGHLTEAVLELKAEGKKEQEAVEIAISRFGGERETKSVVARLFKVQKTFAKWMLTLALVSLVLSSVVFATMTVIADRNLENSEEIAYSLLERLGESEALTEEIKNEITSIVNQNEKVRQIEVFKLENDPNALRGEPDFIYQKDIWETEVFGSGWENSNASGESNWFVGIGTKVYNSFASTILLVGIAVYWVLFTLWAIVNAHHRNRLNAGWIVAFALFNVIGYLVYSLTGNKNASSNIEVY